jgi:hypothetical protein
MIETRDSRDETRASVCFLFVDAGERDLRRDDGDELGG